MALLPADRSINKNIYQFTTADLTAVVYKRLFFFFYKVWKELIDMGH